ncbi:MAG: hypothetical protein GXP45_07115 [bacterium]|nr:hypothetical protein [bacterium]
MLRQQCEQRHIPIISLNTEAFLHEILNEHQPKQCLEIGTAIGYSSHFIAKEIAKRNGKIYSFEVSYTAYLEALNTTQKEYNTTIYPFNFLKTKLNKLIPNTKKIDFVFIDAQKSQYGDYIMKIRNLLTTSTILVIDDVIKYHHKMISLYEFLKQKQINYETLALDKDDGVILIQK